MKIHFQKTKPSLITYRIQKKFGREEMMGDLKTVTETHSLSLVKFIAQKMFPLRISSANVTKSAAGFK